MLELPALSGDLLLKIVVITAIGVVSLLLKTASLSGFVAGMILGGVVIVFGGWDAFIVIAFFHVVAAAFTRFRYEKKRRMGVAQEKGGARGWGNVVANGAWAAAAVGFESIVGGRGFVGAYLASVSTGLADTLATEIGLLSRREPRLITDLRKTVERGASGGVTPLGTSVALLASATIGALAVALTGPIGVDGMLAGTPASTMLLTSVVGGLVGTTADSIIGATVQGMYVCESCGKTTEKRVHCGIPSRRIRGHPFIDNNVVNFTSIFVSFVIGYALASWI